MFTLAALVGRAQTPASPIAEVPRPRASATGSTPAHKEGSGIIDLNALARQAEERARRAQSEPPPSAFAREALTDEPPPPAAHRMRAVIVGAAAASIFAIGLFVAFHGGDDAAPPPVAARHAAQEAPKTLDDVAPVTAAPAADVVDDAAPKPSKGAGKVALGGHARKASVKKVQSSGVAAAPAAPKAKSTGLADPCGCHGNLQCTMKCLSSK